MITTVNKRKAKFLVDYMESRNSLCSLFSHVADTELKELQCWMTLLAPDGIPN